MKIKKIILIMILLLPVTSTGAAFYDQSNQYPDKQIFVSNEGNDQHTGTIHAPLKTISKAIDSAAPNTTIYVREGIYKEQIIVNRSGLRHQPITIKPYQKEKVVIDGTDVEVTWDHQGLISIKDQSYITIEGFEIRNYRTDEKDLVPAGIFAGGSGTGINILKNHIHHIETAHPDGNAHGIAFYGTSSPRSLNHIMISGNIVEHLKLGWSESLVLNGNVSNFTVKNNTIRFNNNIGIDVIGFEGVAPNKKYDQARNGRIHHNTVYQNSSYLNPAYDHDYSAGGIYVDGGKNIEIRANHVFQNDIGIEAASEHKNKSTSSIDITENIIVNNNGPGIAIGGYDEARGRTVNADITNNILYQNDSKDQGYGQILIQYNTYNNKILNNVIVAGPSNWMITSIAEKSQNKINKNTYVTEDKSTEARWIWESEEITGLTQFQKLSKQDRKSRLKSPNFTTKQLDIIQNSF
ncbi:right-handed parallel beta-helix repeat-containing protein [Jeotgalibacillus terrae]|uniref:Nitrous oxide reductase family maturation protein NosD n=1 Tax=Jeotgalibacillus terrae TaxID=587735 RepID=A0ABW5ZPD3_9BACL|nr:right-handed parallel beta-helix repeat-containing protein [Jeotgalibacillus terrae]MBM7578217.1 hypothetical protein [Jeotgalibacillus terrae]